ncbi:hypothetical protein CLAFUW4_05318 [Fulvia fulva]|nr:hypothetical protein CLAFUR4_05312 [Fulvia fulva]WPV15438.1 hypothetical protein CLAFUW4_05318 [Fulvia fulva]WPV29627.1 hypothetical protein CLAFUW7_05317 [Fulvia fulva]
MAMDLDWNDPMAMFGGGFPAEAQQQQQSHDEVADDDNDDDFYGEQTQQDTSMGGMQQQQQQQQPTAQGGAQPGASDFADQSRTAVPAQHVPTPAPPPAAATLSPKQKADNERQLQLLKAKLLAKRQNTPSRPASTTAQVGTPTPALPPPQLHTAPPAAATNVTETKEEEEGKISDGVNGIDALLDQGKAMAEARSAAELASASAPAHSTPNGFASQHRSSVQQDKQPVPQPRPTPQVAQTPQRSTNLSDEYYADLPAWLEMTGYHDVAFRNSKLSVNKQRRELERQAAEIAEQIERIKQKEQETIMELRASSTPITTNMAAPPLPKTMPTPQANGTKRGRSPDLFGSEKARRQENGGFRIRGANESSTDARPSERRFSRSPPGLDRRISYPDARRRSTEGKSRDPSLERRQSYYRRDDEAAPPTPRYNDHWAPQSPRDGPRPSPRYPAGPGRQNSYTRAPQYSGSASLNNRKGGQANGRPKPK